MAISRRTDYALRLVAIMAASGDEPISVRTASEAQGVPYAFARSIQHDLTLAGIVTARRGSHGGVVLARPASELTVLDIIEAMQGRLTMSVCAVDDDWCPRSDHCAFHELWIGADKILRDYLASYTIESLASDFAAGGAEAIARHARAFGAEDAQE